MTEKEDHGAPDGVKPESPWRWQQVEAEDAADDVFILIGPRGEDLLCAGAESGYGEGWCNGSVSPSPAVRELIRLAPAMESALRKLEWSADDPFANRQHACPECSVVEAPHLPECSIGNILAALDAARAVKP